MRKRPALIAFLALTMMTAACKKPVETIISKYFQAMSSKDLDTLDSFAVDPLFFDFKSWKLISSEEESIDVDLPDLIKKRGKLGSLLEKSVQLNEAASSLGMTYDDDLNKLMLSTSVSLVMDAAKLDETIKLHEKLIPMSLGLKSPDPEKYASQGKCHGFEALVKVAGKNKGTEYLFHLRRYEFMNPATKKPYWNRLIIWKIEPQSNSGESAR